MASWLTPAFHAEGGMPLIHPWMAPDLCERGPNVQQQRAVDRIKEQHGYSRLEEDGCKDVENKEADKVEHWTNAELGKMVEDLTGRRPPPRTSKTTLVSRIERASLGDMRKSKTAQVCEKAPKRGCRATISKGQLAQMRSVLKSEASALALRHSHKDLEKMWNRMGMIAMYPKMTGKETVISRMKAFATRNIEHHGL
ncbi:unnamed protein product [Symbiodinium sp. CCMP2592]|nr:unnamed protein product [Symbiodinium sp. CCMP2592]